MPSNDATSSASSPDGNYERSGRGRQRTEAQLEHKRARDRESQRSHRRRTKQHVADLEAELQKLQARYDRLVRFTEQLGNESAEKSAWTPSRLIGVSTEFDMPSLPEQADEGTRSKHTISSQRQDSHELKKGVGLYQALPADFDFQYDLALGGGRLGAADRKSTLPSLATTVSGDAVSNSCLCHSVHEKGGECLEYRIFQILYDAHMGIAANVGRVTPYPRTPTVSNLLLIDTETNPLVKVLGEMLSNFCPIELPDAMAAYVIIYRLLRWRVLPIPETYYDIPEWFRPSALQRSVAHPVCVDFIAWPALRDFLVTRIQYLDVATLGRDVGECLTAQWPRDEQLLVRDLKTNATILNPKFEEHIWNLDNWRMRKSWAWKQPQLVKLVNMSDD